MSDIRMGEEKIIVLKKIERQLILYRYLGSPCIKMRDEVLSLYDIPASTIYKDMKDLTDAGLINLRYDAELDEYVCSQKANNYDPSKDKPNRVKHLKRLNRLARCLDELTNDPMSYEYTDEDEEGNYDVIFIKGEKSCKEHYMEMFPNESVRTMQRDFITLTNAGFPVRYNREFGCYEFFTFGEYEDDYYFVDGVFKDSETGKICRKCGGYNDYEIQENYFESIRGKRKGLPRDEWEPY